MRATGMRGGEKRKRGVSSVARAVFSFRFSSFPSSRIEEAFMTGYRFMAQLRRYYTCIGRFERRCAGNDERRGWDASNSETYMVFGLEKTGEFSEVQIERKEAVIREGGLYGRRARRRKDCALHHGSNYCRDNEAKARFLPFQSRTAKRYLE